MHKAGCIHTQERIVKIQSHCLCLTGGPMLARSESCRRVVKHLCQYWNCAIKLPLTTNCAFIVRDQPRQNTSHQGKGMGVRNIRKNMKTQMQIIKWRNI